VLYEALLVQHKYGTRKVYLANEYVQYKAMQDIREMSLEIVGQTQTPRYVSRFEPLLYVPASHRRISIMSTQDLPQREPPPRNYSSTLGVHYSTLKYNHLYTRGKAQSQNSIISTQEGWAQSQTTITSTQEGQDTKPSHNLNHIYTRGTRHKAKIKKRLQNW